jgi:hypothetical protein
MKDGINKTSTPFALSLSKGKRSLFILRPFGELTAQDERAQAVVRRGYFSSLNICASNR